MNALDFNKLQILQVSCITVFLFPLAITLAELVISFIILLLVMSIFPRFPERYRETAASVIPNLTAVFRCVKPWCATRLLVNSLRITGRTCQTMVSQGVFMNRSP